MRAIFVAFFWVASIFASEVEIDSFESEFSDEEIFDPLSDYNRYMTHFNDVLYNNVFIPILKGYDFVVPDEGQSAIANFFDNLMFPVRFVNNILQLKFKNAGEETLRFVANTIVGFGGISDVATNVYGLKKHDEDFGQTLGFWGVGSGFPVVLPILGHSNLRDIVGMGGDYFANPLTYSNEWFATDSDFVPSTSKIFKGTNEQSIDPEKYERLTSEALDLYIFMREAYEQHRNQRIRE